MRRASATSYPSVVLIVLWFAPPRIRRHAQQRRNAVRGVVALLDQASVGSGTPRRLFRYCPGYPPAALSGDLIRNFATVA